MKKIFRNPHASNVTEDAYPCKGNLLSDSTIDRLQATSFHQCDAQRRSTEGGAGRRDAFGTSTTKYVRVYVFVCTSLNIWKRIGWAVCAMVSI